MDDRGKGRLSLLEYLVRAEETDEMDQTVIGTFLCHDLL